MMIVELVVDVVSLNSCLLCCVGCMLIVISVGFVSGLVIMLILDQVIVLIVVDSFDLNLFGIGMYLLFFRLF